MRRAVVMTPCGQLKGSSPRRSGIRGRALNTIARTLLGAALGATLSVRAAAQDRPPPAAEFAAGALFFADDGVVTEGLAGGGVRIYVSPRVSIGPEVAFILGERHSHMMLTGNVTFDLRAPVKGVPREVTPFVVVGGGLFQTREEFPNDETFASNEGAFTAGGGVRAQLGSRMFVVVESRIGWELHLRLNGALGIRF